MLIMGMVIGFVIGLAMIGGALAAYAMVQSMSHTEGRQMFPVNRTPETPKRALQGSA